MSDRSTRSIYLDESHSAVVPGSRVIRSAELAHVGGRTAVHHGAPSIELIKDGNTVRAIDVTCSCGEKIRLWCAYDADSEVRSTH